MNCKCKHQAVCEHNKIISEAFEPIIELLFGGKAKEWYKVEELTRTICRYHSPKTKNEIEKEKESEWRL